MHWIKHKSKKYLSNKKIHKKYKCTIVFVTHYLNEAKELATGWESLQAVSLKNVYDLSEIKEIKAI